MLLSFQRKDLKKFYHFFSVEIRLSDSLRSLSSYTLDHQLSITMETIECDFSSVEGILRAYLSLIGVAGSTRDSVLQLILDNLPTTGSFIWQNVELALSLAKSHTETGLFIAALRMRLESLQTNVIVQAGWVLLQDVYLTAFLESWFYWVTHVVFW